MGRPRSDNLQGTLDLLVLKALDSRGAMHGYAIANHVQQVTDEMLRIEEGSLYPALHRMEGDGWIDSEWSISATNRRVKVYRITGDGKKQLAREEEQWNRFNQAVSKALRFA
jgi:PadR family transcriptional regulator PadR